MPNIGDLWRSKLREVCERGRARSGEPEFKRILAQYEARISEEARAAVKYRRKLQGIPEIFSAVLDKPRDTKAMRDASEWLKSSARFGLFLGPKGTGKTAALSHIVDFAGGRYVEVGDLLGLGFQDGSLNALREAPILALDEMGRESPDQKGWGENKLYWVVNGRFQAGKRTVFASNLSLSEFEKRYGTGPLEALWDRISSSCDTFEIAGASMRQQGGEP